MVRRVAAAAILAGLLGLATACNGSQAGSESGGQDQSDGGLASGARRGGTLYVMTGGDRITHLDPQRSYNGVEQNFAGSFLQRTLTSYQVAHGKPGTEIVPDLATDTGRPFAGGRTWQFTLREGVTFEDGSQITCADVKYGVSRTFAQDVITDGPQYAVSMLDIPTDAEGRSIYAGPYRETPEGVAAFNRAVTCSPDGRTVTFRLARAVPDFNGATTLLAFSPVPKRADTAEAYDREPVSSGPYRIESYTDKKSLVLVRNENWNASSDPVRLAYPDRVVMLFSLNPQVVDARIERSSGEDAYAVSTSAIDPADLSRLFGNPRLSDRISKDPDPYVRYFAINAEKVPVLKHRQALMAALDREALNKLAGGVYAGEVADGVLTPGMGSDYAPTGIWQSGLGGEVPLGGNPQLAKRLIASSGSPPPVIVLDYNKAKDDTTQDKAAALTKDSWESVGFTVRLNPLEQSAYYPTVLDPAKQGSVCFAGWGPDWLNASTILPELFTPDGAFSLSRWSDPEFVAAVEDAETTMDRAAQAAKWQKLNRRAVELGLVIPLRFGQEELIFGEKVRTATYGGKPYSSAPYGGPPFADLYLE